jgi:hypothetical protein
MPTLLTSKRFFNVDASTKRNPAPVAGKIGPPVAYLASLQCAPVDPAQQEILLRTKIETPHKVLQTYVLGDYDIRENDTFVVGSGEFTIIHVGEWTCSDGTLYEILMQDVKVR